MSRSSQRSKCSLVLDASGGIAEHILIFLAGDKIVLQLPSAAEGIGDSSAGVLANAGVAQATSLDDTPHSTVPEMNRMASYKRHDLQYIIWTIPESE